MKIRPVTEEHRAKVYALLRAAFPRNGDQAALVERLHANNRPLHEWVCLHINKAVAYIAFSNAYHGDAVCGLHLAPLAVAPEMRGEGVDAELLNFALRQAPIKGSALFVLGDPAYYKKFGFAPCRLPLSPFDAGNHHFSSLRDLTTTSFTIGYEPEFHATGRASRPPGKKHR